MCSASNYCYFIYLRGGSDESHTFDAGPGVGLYQVRYSFEIEDASDWEIRGEVRTEELRILANSSATIHDKVIVDDVVNPADTKEAKLYGTLVVAEGGVLDARSASYYETGSQTTIIENGVILRDAMGVGFTDMSGVPLSEITLGDDIYVTLYDDDENLSGSTHDVSTVVVRSVSTGDEETLTVVRNA